VLPSQLPRTTRVAAFRNGPRRRGRLPRLIGLLALVGAACGGVWWLWPAGGILGHQEREPLATAEPVGLNLDVPSPARRAQRAVRDLPTTDKTPKPATPQTIAARPEPPRPLPPPTTTPTTTPTRIPTQPASAPVAYPGPVELKQTLSSPHGAAPPLPPSPGPAQKTPVQPASETVSDPPPPPREAPSDPAVARFSAQAEAALASNRPVDARFALNRALHAPGASASDRHSLRTRLTDLNAKLVFSSVATPGDPLAETYAVQSGDSLAKIVAMHDLNVDWRLVQRINALSDPRKLRVGQKLKLVSGPFHAVVNKRDYRLDLYADLRDPDGNRLYIRSFPVGLGEHDSTPPGKFTVKSGSKLVDPYWVNPRTGQRFANTDPLNPIGERWIGLEGADPASANLTGYGLHGTIDPASIGHDASMGCVRMLGEDVEVLYELLQERVSQVEIR